MQIFSYENEFDLYGNQCLGEIHIFARILALIDTKTTDNWEMVYYIILSNFYTDTRIRSTNNHNT